MVIALFFVGTFCSRVCQIPDDSLSSAGRKRRPDGIAEQKPTATGRNYHHNAWLSSELYGVGEPCIMSSVDSQLLLFSELVALRLAYFLSFKFQG